MKKFLKPLLSLLLVITMLSVTIVPAAAVNTPGKIDYVAFGDSNAAGVRAGIGEPGCELGSDYGYTDNIANKLLAENLLGGFNEDFCTSGMTAKQLALDTDVLNQSWTAQAQLVCDAEIATLDIGANDLLGPLYDYVSDIKSVSDISVEKGTEIFNQLLYTLYHTNMCPEIEQNTETILQNILNANGSVRIFVMGYYNPLPTASAMCGIDLNDAVKYFNSFIQKAVEDTLINNPGASVTYIDTFTAMASAANTLVTFDIHPTMTGYRVIADEFWKKIEPMLGDFLTAYPTSAKVFIDGKNVAFEAYNINGNNYFKLRDLAMALNGSPKQFNVTYNSTYKTVWIWTQTAYSPVGNELSVPGNTIAVTPIRTVTRFYLDSLVTPFTAYNIGGNNYIKLRDVAAKIDFGVGWDDPTKTISIDTLSRYIP